jgi:hypothetical protein
MKLIGVIGGVVAAAIGLAAPAATEKGDQDAYAYWLTFHKWDPSATVDQARFNAEAICGFRRGGKTENDVIKLYLDKANDVAGAQAVVGRAEYHFCPDYWSGSDPGQYGGPDQWH